VSGKLELELTVGDVTVKVCSVKVCSDSASSGPEFAFDPDGNVGDSLRGLGEFLDALPAKTRITVFAFLRERYRDNGERR
jgi:hypothetical protein